MTSKNFIVYMHTNRINGKRYIGITCQKPEQRWRNGKGYTNGHFKNAIEKYGWDCFVHEILFTNLSKSEAEEKEIELIAKYKTMDNKFGYNLAIGGNVTTGYHHTEESKKKMSELKKGLYDGCKNPMFGKRGVLAPAYGLKRSEKFKKERQAEVIVLDYDYNEICICESINEASKKFGVDSRTISTICRGNRKSSHGYRFKYKDADRLKKSRKDKHNESEE